MHMFQDLLAPSFFVIFASCVHICAHTCRSKRKGMDRIQARERITHLKAVLIENSRRYYVDNAPTMSDYEYDTLMHELERLEEEWPEFADPDSPTRRVGSDLDKPVGENAEPLSGREFKQYPHRYPMLSLGNTYSIGEIEEFAERASKILEGRDFSYCCELKFDGTAICLTYRDGKLFRALTRGDGAVGDDVTENVRHIANIPERLKGSGYPDEFEIRGEILMPFSSFRRLNAEREESGLPPFANPRNAASGSLKLLDPEEVGRRGLECTLYHIPSENIDAGTHKASLEAAASWGLPVSEHLTLCKDIAGIEGFISHWDVARKDLPFPTDGVVIKINELALRRELGYTSKSPRWAVAYKFKAEQALTQIVSIDYQVGRTGAVTPVANLKPVHLAGTTVKRATLNNQAFIEDLDIRIGDWVYVEKGGEIIPKISAVDFSRRIEGTGRPRFPEKCPDCGTPLVRPEGEARWFCPNVDGCPTQIQGKLVHFMSRKAMNVIAGEATVEQLYALGLVSSPADLYDLDEDKLLFLEGWKTRSARRFLDSLDESRKVPFERVLFAIGIRYVGEQTAKSVARHFGDIDAIMAASVEELAAVPDVGDTIARSIYDYFRDERHVAGIRRLRDAGLQMASVSASAPVSAVLEGKTIVVSGTFSVSRDEIKAMVEACGGKNSGSVSGKTSYLLAGEKPGPEKIRKAEELGIPVIGEDEFRAMTGQSAEASAIDEEPTLF